MPQNRPPQPNVKIRILTPPADKLLEGIVDADRFQVGQSYDVGPHLADLLIVSGHAALERRTPGSRRRQSDRGQGRSGFSDV